MVSRTVLAASMVAALAFAGGASQAWADDVAFTFSGICDSSCGGTVSANLDLSSYSYGQDIGSTFDTASYMGSEDKLLYSGSGSISGPGPAAQSLTFQGYFSGQGTFTTHADGSWNFQDPANVVSDSGTGGLWTLVPGSAAPTGGGGGSGGGGGPEPSTWALMMVGVFGAGAALRRRQTSALNLA